MPGMLMLRGTLSAIGTVFGGLGVFFLYCSFIRAEMAVYALMFPPGTATATPRRAGESNTRCGITRRGNSASEQP